MSALRTYQQVGQLLTTSMSVNLTTEPSQSLKAETYGWYIQPHTTAAERLIVDDIQNNILVLNRPPRMAHPDGAKLVCITEKDLTFGLYGGIGQFMQDDWRAMQRAVIENPFRRIHGGTNGRFFSFVNGQPVHFTNGIDLYTMEFFHAGAGANVSWTAGQVTGIQNDYPDGRQGSWRGVGDIVPFRADHNQDKIIFLTSVDIEVGTAISFNNPYFETMPGGIVSGKPYKIKSYDSLENSITLSAWDDVTNGTVNIINSGSNPAGLAYLNSQKPILAKFYAVNFGGAGYLGDALQAHFRKGSWLKN